LLHALQWGLYGNNGLPDSGKEFRKSPHIEDPKTTESVCEIKVDISYEIMSTSGPKKYRLIRTSREKISGVDFQEESSKVHLFLMSRNGAVEEEHPDARISHDLSKDLREVFFTDGDRALSFIQGNRNEPMKRVEMAIRSLLGLTLYEEAIIHTKKVITDLNKKVKDSYGDQKDIEECTEAIENFQNLTNDEEKNLIEAETKSDKATELLREIERQISAAARKGNREDLVKELKQVIEKKDDAMDEAQNANKKLSDLFKEEVIAKHLLRKKFDDAKISLDKLHEKGEIPSQTVPVLQERLKVGSCICGESLDLHDHEANDRRKRIEQLIKESSRLDETIGKLTDLFFTSKKLLDPIESEDEKWPNIREQIFKEREKAYSNAENLGKRQTELEQMIAEIPDVNMQQLNDFRQKYIEDRDNGLLDKNTHKSNLREITEKIKDFEARRDSLLRDSNKGKQLYSELVVAKDLQGVIENSLETMKTSELKKVSELMNLLFLQIIGSGKDEQTDIINSAEIRENYKIRVFGKLKQKLDPTYDLNGASRRALTIAFILALTKVSEAEAPNVIDTPLGMMSGFVKQMTIQIASHQSSQLILFLTHSEIRDCEKIIEDLAGKVYTFTNPALYPLIIKNKPAVEDSRIVQCNCSHLEDCELCALTQTAQNAISKNISLKDFFKWGKN